MAMLAAFVISVMGVCLGAAAQQLKMAHLGDCPLDSGEKIIDCQVGYRTFGTLNASRSNAVLFPTWATGTSAQAIQLVGPGKMLDSSKYFVILIDSLSNGVSSSPSNSVRQPRMSFPQITIHDMVTAAHAVVVQTLHLSHVYAVVGQSMGGMQTFDWMVSYPDFMDKAIPIIGSPRLASYDLLLWQTEIDRIKIDPAWKTGNYTVNPAVAAEARISELTLATPEAVNREVKDGVLSPEVLAGAQMIDANNRIRQCEAMMALDVSKQTHGSMLEAAERVKAKVLVIVSKQDHTVTPEPALEFAKMLKAQTLTLNSDCGHLAPACELQTVATAVGNFLK